MSCNIDLFFVSTDGSIGTVRLDPSHDISLDTPLATWIDVQDGKYACCFKDKQLLEKWLDYTNQKQISLYITDRNLNLLAAVTNPQYPTMISMNIADARKAIGLSPVEPFVITSQQLLQNISVTINPSNFVELANRNEWDSAKILEVIGKLMRLETHLQLKYVVEEIPQLINYMIDNKVWDDSLKYATVKFDYGEISIHNSVKI